jgi:integrase
MRSSSLGGYPGPTQKGDCRCDDWETPSKPDVSRVSALKIGFDTEEQITDSSLVAFQQSGDVVKNLAIDGEAPNTVNSPVRTREYLTEAEIERLMGAARKSSRYGHRDATMILIGYRHGLRASELCDLQWSQVELATGRLHVRRAKNGSPSVHPAPGRRNTCPAASTARTRAILARVHERHRICRRPKRRDRIPLGAW